MDESVKAPTQSHDTSKYWITALWALSLFLVGIISYEHGKDAMIGQQNAADKVLSAESNQESTLKPPVANSENTTVASAPNAPATTENSGAIGTNSCSKTGFAQKWEYLTPYVLKESDSLQAIATEQLKDGSRVNELLQINGVGPLVAGSTIYLPPTSIPKSSGNLKQINGKLVERNDASWHISFTTDKSGQGILIPAYLFQTVPNAMSYTIGSCVSIFMDDGYKVYSVALQ